jgi:hypothetical protein
MAREQEEGDERGVGDDGRSRKRGDAQARHSMKRFHELPDFLEIAPLAHFFMFGVCVLTHKKFCWNTVDSEAVVAD